MKTLNQNPKSTLTIRRSTAASKTRFSPTHSGSDQRYKGWWCRDSPEFAKMVGAKFAVHVEPEFFCAFFYPAKPAEFPPLYPTPEPPAKAPPHPEVFDPFDL